MSTTRTSTTRTSTTRTSTTRTDHTIGAGGGRKETHDET